MRTARIARSDAFGDDFDCWGHVEKDGAIVVRQAALQSVQLHPVPIDIEYEVMTDSTDIRIGYGANQIIFNWGGCLNELRIDGDPAGTRNIHGMGYVKPNQFVKIRQVVTDDSMALYVDGVERASWRSDFSGYRGRIKLFTVGGATLSVRAIRIAGK